MTGKQQQSEARAAADQATWPTVTAHDEATGILLARLTDFLKDTVAAKQCLSAIDPVARRADAQGEIEATLERIWHDLAAMIEYRDAARQRVQFHARTFGSHMIQ